DPTAVTKGEEGAIKPRRSLPPPDFRVTFENLAVLAFEQLFNRLPVAPATNGHSDLLLGAAAADSESNTVIRRNLRYKPTELTCASHIVLIDPQNYVARSKASLLSRTVLGHTCDTNTARFAKSVATHVFYRDLFGIDAQIAATVQKERQGLTL